MTPNKLWFAPTALLCLFTATASGAVLTATNTTLPYRAVAATTDVYALRYNPAGLAFDTPVELAFLHQFARVGAGGDNSLILRAKTLAASINWVKDRGFGKWREYNIGGGHLLGPNLSFGTTYNYIKADDPAYNSKHFWTHSIFYRYSPMITIGVRWENPWHTKIADVPTDGQIVAGITVQPIDSRLTASADWFIPDDSRFKDSFLRGAAQVRISRAIDLAGFADTDGWIGVEFRWMRQRSATGIEIRGDDLKDYSDGTLYLSVKDREYRPQRTPGLAKIR